MGSTFARGGGGIREFVVVLSTCVDIMEMARRPANLSFKLGISTEETGWRGVDTHCSWFQALRSI